MTMMVKKSQMITLVLSVDRDFKHRAINFMNNIAFQSEKLSAESMEEAKAILDNNPRVLNLLIDGAFFGDAFNDKFASVEELSKKPNLMTLVLLSDKQHKAFNKHDHTNKNILVRMMPMNKQDFNEAFHSRAGQSSNPFAKDAASPLVGAATAAAANKSKPEDAAKKSLTAFEASAHVKDTLEHIKALAKDRRRLDALSVIGQRFNGMMGAFAFLESKVGMASLKKVAVILDSIARTYEQGDRPEVSQAHYDLLLNSAKVSYQILTKLRDDPSSPLPKELLDQEEKCWKEFESMEELVKRRSQSQEEVDNLLKDLQ